MVVHTQNSTYELRKDAIRRKATNKAYNDILTGGQWVVYDGLCPHTPKPGVRLMIGLLDGTSIWTSPVKMVEVM